MAKKKAATATAPVASVKGELMPVDDYTARDLTRKVEIEASADNAARLSKLEDVTARDILLDFLAMTDAKKAVEAGKVWKDRFFAQGGTKGKQTIMAAAAAVKAVGTPVAGAVRAAILDGRIGSQVNARVLVQYCTNKRDVGGLQKTLSEHIDRADLDRLIDALNTHRRQEAAAGKAVSDYQALLGTGVLGRSPLKFLVYGELPALALEEMQQKAAETPETPAPTPETPAPTPETPAPTPETPETPAPTSDTPAPAPTTETPAPTTETPAPTSDTPLPPASLERGPDRAVRAPLGPDDSVPAFLEAFGIEDTRRTRAAVRELGETLIGLRSPVACRVLEAATAAARAALDASKKPQPRKLADTE